MKFVRECLKPLHLRRIQEKWWVLYFKAAIVNIFILMLYSDEATENYHNLPLDLQKLKVFFSTLFWFIKSASTLVPNKNDL